MHKPSHDKSPLWWSIKSLNFHVLIHPCASRFFTKWMLKLISFIKISSSCIRISLLSSCKQYSETYLYPENVFSVIFLYESMKSPMMKSLNWFISFCKSFFLCVFARNIVPWHTDPGTRILAMGPWDSFRLTLHNNAPKVKGNTKSHFR